MKGVGRFVFDTFEILTNIPYNIWPWLFLIVAPLLVFSATPGSSVKWRIGRILIAVCIGYVLINLTLHTHRALQWKEYEACQSQFEDGYRWIHSECEHLAPMHSGLSYIFYLVLGWIPAAAYAGFWEFWWRRKYQFIIGRLGKKYRGKWFSTLLIVCSVPVWIYIILLIVIFALNI